MAMVSDRFRKWFLVIVMSLLMIAFTLPAWFGQGMGGTRDFAVATLANDQKLMASEVQLARFEWQELSAISIPLMVDVGFGRPQTVRAPLPALLFVGDLGRPLTAESQQVVEGLLTLYNRSPELYALLKREARQLGLRPSRDRIESVMTNLVPAAMVSDTRRLSSLRQAVAGLLAVEALRDQSLSAVKVTRPEVASLVARNLQTLNVVAVPLSTEPFSSPAPEPYEATLRDLYNRYADKLPGSFDRTNNPFGFGYRQGDRLRLEYIFVPRSELRRAARATRDEYDWEVEAQKYYQANRSRFESPDPAPAANASTPGDLSLSPTTGPAKTLRPFAEVREQIENQLVDAKADDIRRTVERRLTAALTADYRAYADALARNRPAPTTSLGHPYNSFDYLSALADRIQRDTGVRPTVVSHGDSFLDQNALTQLEGIRQATVEVGGGRELPLVSYLFARARPLFEANNLTREPGAAALEPYEPAPMATTTDGGLLLARFIDARPTRVPDFAEVVDLVRADAVRQAVFDRTLEAARQLAARETDQPLSDVATRANLTALPLANLTDGVFLPPPLSGLHPTSKAAFIEESFNLLRKPEAFTGGRPRVIVPLHRDNLVVVVELQSVNPLPRFMEPARLELQVFQQVLRQAEEQYRFSFFIPDTVQQRNGYKSLRGGEASAGAF